MAASPFSLRPWPTGDKKPKNLGEFVARVHAEPGGFRSVSEDQLRDDIKAQDGADLSSPSSAEDNDDQDDEAAQNDDDTKDAIAAREEFFRSCDHAHQSAMLALDAISLLLSKEMPVQAGTTLSSALRDAVGIGTLGASRLHDSNVTEARTKNDLAVATGWRVMGLDKMVDSVMAAAGRLEREMELEAKYWADVLAVSDSGWAVCSLPHDPPTLGVRFGFSEAAPEYRDQSLAPLIRQDDGTVRLETSRVGRGSQRIRAAVERGGVITALSQIPLRTPDDAPLPDRVLEARNTAFSQELWYELNREARTLLSYGVQTTETEVTYQAGPDTKVILTLHDLADVDKDESPMGGGGGGGNSSHEDRELADSVSMVLHFLLSFAHRQNYRTRTQPTAAKPSQAATPPYALLRPLLARTRHVGMCGALSRFLGDLVGVLRRAGVAGASYTMTVQPVAVQPHQEAQVRRSSKSEILSTNLVHSMDLQAELTLTPAARLNIRGRTFMHPWIGQQLRVFLAPAAAVAVVSADGAPPPAAATAATTSSPGPLESSYPPSGEGYPDLPSLMTYIRNATLRALSHSVAVAAATDPALAGEEISRSEGFTGPTITSSHGAREVRLTFATSSDSDVEGVGGGGSSSSQHNSSKLVLQCEGLWRPSPSSLAESAPSMAAVGNGSGGSGMKIQRWTWAAAAGGGDGTTSRASSGDVDKIKREPQPIDNRTPVTDEAGNSSMDKLEDVVFKVLGGKL
ncbi:mediator of RNA polymerase II transcription subunit 17 [Microdochium nivale]|nr:mediator of RNA polymerase II transcription subunit 17 [Microdochium nivale]